MGCFYSPSGAGAGWVDYSDFAACGGACSVYRCRCLDGDRPLRWNGGYFLGLVDGLGWVRYSGVVLAVFAAPVE